MVKIAFYLLKDILWMKSLLTSMGLETVFLFLLWLHQVFAIFAWGLHTMLLPNLCLAQKAAVKWNLVPGDIISLTLTLSPSFAIDYYLHQSETRSPGSQFWEGCWIPHFRCQAWECSMIVLLSKSRTWLPDSVNTELSIFRLLLLHLPSLSKSHNCQKRHHRCQDLMVPVLVASQSYTALSRVSWMN